MLLVQLHSLKRLYKKEYASIEIPSNGGGQPALVETPDFARRLEETGFNVLIPKPLHCGIIQRQRNIPQDAVLWVVAIYGMLPWAYHFFPDPQRHSCFTTLSSSPRNDYL